MSFNPESQNYMSDESLRAFVESQNLEGILFPEFSGKISLSSLFSITLEEVPAVETSTEITATSLSNSNEGLRNQEEKSVSMPGTGNLLKAALYEKMAKLVELLLLKYRMKEVITKKDMLKMVVREYEKHFFEILSMASERLELIFGIDVLEVNRTIQSYALFKKLNITYDGLQDGNECKPKTGLLILILGIIFMKGNRATEEDVWKVLNRMGIYSGQNHFLYGEPRKLIMEDLVLGKYLDYRKVPKSVPPRYEFWWGPRAHFEINKVKFLEFFSQINDADSPTYSSRFEEALRDEENRASVSHMAIIYSRLDSSSSQP
ncbi:PREDICTED: melanoma-associated antigen B16-like [Elephantulus edwardii]|uniref:melanoma-associated antigen B16-like n=1 Tax=Elephantulus edwardii TaxID=28737 RepID=UPI0003F076DE|nr:PREDICTED: melanoma-associated antigen B16-like [Elephantulus edwardii]